MEPGWEEYMRTGQWAKAWDISDAVLAERAGKPCWHWPRHFQYIWDGSPLAGKCVLVRCYHGLGDTIQFIRYIPLLKQVAAQVTVWVQDRLIPLLRQSNDMGELLALHDGTPEVVYDVDVELMELPHIFRTTPTTIPGREPYLKVAPYPFPVDPEKFKVGLVWRSGGWNEARSIPFALLQPLFEVPCVEWYLLQQDPAEAGWDGHSGNIIGGQTIEEDAAIISALDLVISVDTMIVHLAGALGKPVWNLLPQPSDWRWMEERTDSPWYPTMRLYRQQEPGNWGSVIREVTAALHALVRSDQLKQ